MQGFIGPVPERRPVVGVDGAPAGWVAVALGEDCRARITAHPDFREVLEAHSDAEVVAVDIPIGLEPDARRTADLAAKAYLRRRASSVFLTPPREALDAASHTDALRVLREAGLAGISAQAFALRRKIVEVDRLVTAGDRVREIHPEVSFRAMNGGVDLRHRKKAPAGFDERRRLLQRSGVWLPAEAFDLKRVGPDDVLDAAAAAWSALRIANGMARTLPDQPDTDGSGRPIAIWY